MIFPTVTANENENKTQGNDVYYIPKEIKSKLTKLQNGNGDTALLWKLLSAKKLHFIQYERVWVDFLAYVMLPCFSRLNWEGIVTIQNRVKPP